MLPILISFDLFHPNILILFPPPLSEETDLIDLIMKRSRDHAICIWKSTDGKGRMFYTKDLILDDIILSMELRKKMVWQWVLLSYDNF